jgi:translation initiation factor 1
MTRLFAGTPFDRPPRCDRCGELEQDCRCEPPTTQPCSITPIDPEKQTARVRVDRRKHKRMVTIVWGLDPSANDLSELTSKLKSACGAGGSIQNDQIEIQGEHLQRVKDQLLQIGYRVQ